jgi:hypothetical protein
MEEAYQHPKYKNYVKDKIKSLGGQFKQMGPEDRKNFFDQTDNEFKTKLKEGMLDELPTSMVNTQDNSMANTMNSDELNMVLVLKMII